MSELVEILYNSLPSGNYYIYLSPWCTTQELPYSYRGIHLISDPDEWLLKENQRVLEDFTLTPQNSWVFNLLRTSLKELQLKYLGEKSLVRIP
jgi:hypothetical protein